MKVLNGTQPRNAYPPEDIALLYRQRWQAELHLRSLKTVLQMDHLRCKTPERVRNEFHMHMVGYNLIRGVMAAAAFQSGRSPWEIKLQGGRCKHSVSSFPCYRRTPRKSGARRCWRRWPRISLAIGPTVSSRDV
jgi:hypothetical protein